MPTDTAAKKEKIDGVFSKWRQGEERGTTASEDVGTESLVDECHLSTNVAGGSSRPVYLTGKLCCSPFGVESPFLPLPPLALPLRALGCKNNASA
jgi:hypothetical protein